MALCLYRRFPVFAANPKEPFSLEFLDVDHTNRLRQSLSIPLPHLRSSTRVVAMRLILLRKSCTAALAAVFFHCGAAPADDAWPPPFDPERQACPGVLEAPAAYGALAGLSDAQRAARRGELFCVEVDLENSPGFSMETQGASVEARYRMAFNNVAEGWSWQPGANPQSEDYYRAKFLPLQSVWEERGSYDHQDKIGETQRMKVVWRTDYFLAFDNPYDFYARGGDDDAGFVATLPAAAAAAAGKRPRMIAAARLVAPELQQSSTFWKATYGKPTDFTLKKRYLMARLEAIFFLDGESGQLLATVRR